MIKKRQSVSVAAYVALIPMALTVLLASLALVLSLPFGLLLGLAGRPLMGLDAMAFASRLQCAYRFNTYIGIAVAGKFAGAPGLAMMGALCGAMVPFANMAAVGMMARHGQGRLLRELLRNPLIVATATGLARLQGAPQQALHTAFCCFFLSIAPTTRFGKADAYDFPITHLQPTATCIRRNPPRPETPLRQRTQRAWLTCCAASTKARHCSQKNWPLSTR